MAKSIKKTISLPKTTAEELERYADDKGLSFSAAITKLCEQSLHNNFDAHYAPYVGRLIDKAADNALSRIEQLLDENIELTVELALAALARETANR